jgi:cobaltochelatase CobT
MGFSAKEEQRFIEKQAAVARAIAGKDTLKTTATASQNTASPLALNPSISVRSDGTLNAGEQRHYIRAQADLAALAHRYHSPKLHQEYTINDPAMIAISDALELVRLEALGAKHMPGLAQNLAVQHEVQGAYLRAALKESNQTPPLAVIIAQLTREALLGMAPPEPLQAAISLWKPFIADKLRAYLPKMQQDLSDQLRFHTHLHHLLIDLQWLNNAQISDVKNADEAQAQASDALGIIHDDAEDDALAEFEREALDINPDTADAEALMDGMEATPEAGAGDDEAQSDAFPDMPNYQPNHPHFSNADYVSQYQVFTTEFDEVIAAEKLVDAEELHTLYQRLQDKIREHHTVSSRLATRLQRLLLAQQTRHWMYELDDGMIDNARLAHLVARPDMRDIYKQELEAPFRDTVVSLLIDNSGSMRGRPITLAAISADILARTLERCGVKVEILGFTTRDWKGGKARKLWLEKGRPESPGRLNDLRHIVYKSADTRFHRARRNIALMLKDGILKENIDGEALQWAYQRLLARKEDRRILMVISDGAPVDDATLSANSGSYLDQHLRRVISSIEQDENTELIAIGIGHDVTRYYARAVTLHDAEALGDTMVREVTKLFSFEGTHKN